MPGGDLPDWTAAVSNLRYLGSFSLTAGGGSFAASLTSLDRSLVVVVGGLDLGTVQRFQVTVQSASPLVITYDKLVGFGPIVAPVNVALTPNWSVIITDTLGGSGLTSYVFADTSPAIIDVQKDGQQAMANSLPVAIASDQSPLARGPVKGYTSMQNAGPVAATLATVVFPATAGLRWLIDHVVWTLRSNAAAGIAVPNVILDGATTIYGSILSTQAINLFLDREVLGPGAGYIGSVNTAVTVGFTVAGPANTVERVQAAGYLVV